jgi:hypothetical protein
MRKEVTTMAGKLVTLVAVFSLVLSAAAFASPAELGMAEELNTGAGAGAVDLEASVREHDQEEEEFVLYLGPLDEIITAIDDRRVN